PAHVVWIAYIEVTLRVDLRNGAPALFTTGFLVLSARGAASEGPRAHGMCYPPVETSERCNRTGGTYDFVNPNRGLSGIRLFRDERPWSDQSPRRNEQQ